MKYIIFIIGTFSTLIAGAQTPDSLLEINGGVTWGVKFGLTQAHLRGDDLGRLSSDGTSTSMPGLQFGVTLNSMISERFWLKHELMATQKAAGIALKDSVNGQYKTDLKWWCMDLFPISACWNYRGFRAYAGPYLSVLVDARIRRKDDAGQFENDHSIFGSGRNFQRQSNYMQKFDYGINVGLEYGFKNGLNISARYTRGFAEMFDWANSLTVGKSTDPTSISIYTDYLNISVGYDFVRPKKR